MIKWKKKLKRKTLDSFQIPAKIQELGVFEDQRNYNFRITAGDYQHQQSFKVTSGLEVYVPVEIQEKLKDASKRTSFVTFEWDEIRTQLGDFENEVIISLSGSSSKREKRLKRAKIKPKTVLRSTVVFIRNPCLLYTSPSPRDRTRSRMPSSA